MKSVLIVSTNWIGDAVMSMPALQLFKELHPEVKITMLTKKSTKALWELHPAVDEIRMMEKPVETARMLRKDTYDVAYILPNSIRSGIVPWLAGIPQRVGPRGHWRRWTLTQVAPGHDGHQQFENQNIFGVEGELPSPHLQIPEEAIRNVEKLIGERESGRPLITLLPGAARGPSKRWPPEYYVELAGRLNKELNAKIVLSGGPDDAESCEDMLTQIGEDALNLAGKTSIAEWAGLLKLSDIVVANDSGGMHLATAVGTPVVGIFGITDPGKTGPLGKAVVLQKSSVQSRAVARESEEAVQALSAVKPEDVLQGIYSFRDCNS